jgi:hypothetical protein
MAYEHEPSCNQPATNQKDNGYGSLSHSYGTICPSYSVSPLNWKSHEAHECWSPRIRFLLRVEDTGLYGEVVRSMDFVGWQFRWESWFSSK